MFGKNLKIRTEVRLSNGLKGHVVGYRARDVIVLCEDRREHFASAKSLRIACGNVGCECGCGGDGSCPCHDGHRFINGRWQ